jgi:broad specificity phosphatase PhoE
MAAEPVQPTPLSRPRPPGSITLARHGEPALSRRVKLDAEGYRRWWALYEEGGILPGQTPPDGLLALARRADVIFASTRRRAVETAEAVVGGRTFVRDPLFIEAPLPPPPLPRLVRLDPKAWGVVSRMVWWFLRWSPPGEEDRALAEVRAREAADRLVRAAETEGEVLLVAHGFFIAMLSRELRKRRWRMTENRGYAYWAVKRFVRR